MKNFFKGISFSSIFAGALAAVTSFLLSAKIGIAGSVIGVAAGSIVSAVATQVYKNVLKASGEKLQNAVPFVTNDKDGTDGAGKKYAAIKAQLEEGGLLKVDLQSTEWTQYNKDRNVTKDSDGSYPVYQLGWFPDYSDPDNYLSPFFRDGNFVNNGYSNKDVNDLIVKQAGQTDAKAREDTLKEIQKLETEDLSTIPLLQGGPGRGHRIQREGCRPRRLLPLPLRFRDQGLIKVLIAPAHP
ncbi:peptides ABC transporter substrate-binding protein [Bifidobacterium adolescentis]|nr:ABC transporter substrate-binding protein [Bifidobacterium adolescentis]SPU24743.1 peptides ABC transporter substrate-binding protein [Bifidobacterium adolescentis]